MPKVRVRGHRQKPHVEGGADWNAIGALMAMEGMTEEEELDFIWAHPELEDKHMGPSTATEGQRRYLPKIYLRSPEEEDQDA